MIIYTPGWKEDSFADTVQQRVASLGETTDNYRVGQADVFRESVCVGF